MNIKKLVFATGNSNKVREVQMILENRLELIGLKEIGCFEEIPETQPTIKLNALQKAQYVVDNYKLDCFAEDTGLEIEALNGEPGVFSARYAGIEKDANANMDLVLKKLKDKKNRSARFKTVVALILNGEQYTFEGIINGKIGFDKLGSNGFGYDPIFIPDGYTQTFAELDDDVKNRISHRAKAVSKLKDFLI